MNRKVLAAVLAVPVVLAGCGGSGSGKSAPEACSDTNYQADIVDLLNVQAAYSNVGKDTTARDWHALYIDAQQLVSSTDAVLTEIGTDQPCSPALLAKRDLLQRTLRHWRRVGQIIVKAADSNRFANDVIAHADELTAAASAGDDLWEQYRK